MKNALSTSLVSFFFLFLGFGFSEPLVWVAETDGNASDAANWDAGRIPTAEDDIILRGEASQAAMSWNAGVNGLPDTVASWTQESSYTNRVTIRTKRTGAFTLFTISGSAHLSGGSWHHVGNTKDDGNTATVWLNVHVGGNVHAESGFTFNASNSGFVRQKGPCSAWETNGGASHGGSGGSTNVYGRGRVYGDYRMPNTLGSGAYSGSSSSNGGGAVLLEINGDFVLDGTVTASAGNGANSCCASGGSIRITANSLSGTGTIQAMGGNTSNKRDGGGGGRIALHLTDPTLSFETFTNAFTGTLSARGSTSTNNDKNFVHHPGAAGTLYVETQADQGRGRMLLRNGGWKKGNGSDVTKFDVRGTATIQDGVTCTLSELRLETHGRIGIAKGGSLLIPTYEAITGDGSAQNVVRFEDGGVLDRKSVV